MQKPNRPIYASENATSNSVVPVKEFNSHLTEHFVSVESCTNHAVYGGVAVSVKYPIGEENAEISLPESVDVNSRSSNNWSSYLQNVLDQPPGNLAFRLMLGGMLFSGAFVAWAWLGQIEEIGSAQGQLIPQGETYKIHPVVQGKVARIVAKEGEVVKAGQVLLELDNQIASNEVQRLQQEQVSDRTRLNQINSLIDRSLQEGKILTEIADAKIQASQAMVMQAMARVEGVEKAIAEVKKKADTTAQLLAQLRADAQAYQERRRNLQPLALKLKERLGQLQADVAAQQGRLERLKPLAQEGAIPRERLFDLEQTLRDRQSAITQSELQELSNVKELLFQAEQALRDRQRSITQTQGELEQTDTEVNRLQAELKQALAEVSRLQAEQAQYQAEKKTTLLESQQKIQQSEMQKTQLQAKAEETARLLNKAQAELKQLAFTAPVDGVVLSLNIRNPGEVVQPGQTIAELAPENAPLVLLAKLPNQEAGSVQTGMPAKVKLDAFPYQDYGIVSGKVTSISPDAKPDQRLGSVYRIEVALELNSTNPNQQKIQFKPGQTATADIVIRQRRIIDILLDPIKQVQKGGIAL